MQQLLIIGTVWPEPNSSAAGSRMLQLIELMLQQEWKITFACAAKESEYMVNLEEIGVSKTSIEVNNSNFDVFIKKLKPNIVIFDRFMTEEQFGWRIAKECPNTLRILNTEDLHCLRKTRQECFKNKTEFTINHLIKNDVTKREIASIYRCDLSLMISDFEINLLKEVFNIHDQYLHYLPFLLTPITQEIQTKWHTYEQRSNFVTIGNFLHQPNWNSILYLKETIWPLIRKELPKATLQIYGAYPSPKVTQLHNPQEGFLIKGRAKSSEEIMMKAKVCLAPLRFGAGIKGKLVEAMCCGTPSVTTKIGAEGMLNEESDWNGFITDDPIKFAKSAITLYQNKNLWQQSQQNGIEIINTRFQKSAHTTAIIDKITQLQNDLQHHRSNNFIGSMLQHHTLRSTEFMARWIEEKNKR
nr:glycosyltransferase [Aquimarina sp. AU474]